MTQEQFYEAKLAFEIDCWDLNNLLTQGEQVVVIDTRSEDVFHQEHISKAINFPHRTMNQSTSQHLNKDTLYVCYCDGIGCNASTKGALKLTKLGFKVKELMGGIEWWKRDGYKTEGKSTNLNAPINCGC